MVHLRRIAVKFHYLLANKRVEEDLAREVAAHLMCVAKRRNIAARREPNANCSSDFLELQLQRGRLGTAQRYPIKIFVLHENMRIMNTEVRMPIATQA